MWQEEILDFRLRVEKLDDITSIIRRERLALVSDRLLKRRHWHTVVARKEPG